MRIIACILFCMVISPAWAQGQANSYNNDTGTQLNLLADIQKQQADLLTQMKSMQQELDEIKRTEQQQLEVQKKLLQKKP